MQDKPKRKRGEKMSRRRFLQVGIASATVSVGAGILARWMVLSDKKDTEVAYCNYTWGPNETRINEVNSLLLQDALIADGLNPAQVEVYDRAMEYETCYDIDGNILSRELLYMENESAMVAFSAGNDAINDDTHRLQVQSVLDTFSRIESFRVQYLDVRLNHGDEQLIWYAPLYEALSAPEHDVYRIGHTP